MGHFHDSTHSVYYDSRWELQIIKMLEDLQQQYTDLKAVYDDLLLIYEKIQADIQQITVDYLQEAIASGKIKIKTQYDSLDERLIFVFTEEGG